jgi:hypothetical protein
MTAYLRHAAEIWSAAPQDAGPTGRFAEVLRGQVQDAGGNVLFEGNADDCVAERAAFRGPAKLVPTDWREVNGDVVGADHSWQLVIAR